MDLTHGIHIPILVIVGTVLVAWLSVSFAMFLLELPGRLRTAYRRARKRMEVGG